jgi:uncharacterized protein
MERLYTFQANVLKTVDNTFYRFLFSKVNWKQRMIGIKGLRGTGKTTMLLQYLKYHLQEEGLYVTADHPWFYEHTLLELADQFEKNGGSVLLIDEIHKYPHWSTELKNIYDGYPDLRVIFTASSALEIQKGEADLSRRVLSYHLPGLSFREYLNLQGHSFKSINLADLLAHPMDALDAFPRKLKPIPLFKQYLRTGYFPFSTMDTEGEFLIKLNQIINTTLETDLATVEEYSPTHIIKVKKLLGVLSESVPFTPNISSLATKMKMGRDTINNFLLHLERGGLLNLLHQETKGVAALQKPDKIYLENTNLSFALKSQPDIGSLRETFFFNQLKNANYTVGLPKAGDFVVNHKWHFEIGGKSKNENPIKNKFLALDDIESPYLNRIPLWMFGFLY